MKKIYNYCDGGLGNRLGSLLGGLYLSKKLNYDYEIFWVNTRWCSCPFDDLFEPTLKFQEGTLTDIFSKNDSCLYLTHDFGFRPPSHVKSISFVMMNNLNYDEFPCNIVYNNNLFPSFIGIETNINLLKELKINNKILNRVKNFVEENNIDENTVGLHVRRTDNPNKLDDKVYIDVINKNLDKKVFLCSDDEDVENRFSQFSNVIVHKKNNYVQKVTQDSDWTSDNGTNIFRQRDAVIDGFVDMLILSRTTPVELFDGTFFRYAQYYNKINIFNK